MEYDGIVTKYKKEKRTRKGNIKKIKFNKKIKDEESLIDGVLKGGM